MTPPAELILAFLSGCIIGPAILVAVMALKARADDRRDDRLEMMEW